jgi:hypothetical protein
MSKPPKLTPAYPHARHRKIAGEVARTVLAVLVLYICLQGIGLVLQIIGAAHAGSGRTDVLGTVASVVSAVAWLIVLIGLVRVVVKVRASRTRRAGCVWAGGVAVAL